MKFRKGEMTTQQIVTMIILIASFAVILFFLAQLGLGTETDSEICHNSVVTRGAGISEIADAVPLECKREAVCISKSGECEKMYKPKVIEVDDKIDVYKALAEEISNCWWMFGEGRVNYVGDTTLPKLYCSICDQVGFDSSVKEIFEGDEFDKKEFYYYMSLANITEEKTYTEYLYGTNDLEALSGGLPYGKINLDKQYFILTGMTSDVSTLGWAAIGAGALIGGTIYTVATGGTGLIAGVLAVGVAGVGGAAVGGGTAYFVAPIIEDWMGNKQISPSLIEANSKEFDNLKCEEIATRS